MTRLIDLDTLSPAERLDLIGELWDSLTDDDVPVTEDVKTILDARIDAMERDPSRGIPWEEVRAALARQRNGR